MATTTSPFITELVGSVDWPSVRDETAALLSELIRIDTTNAPGNELPAADLLADELLADGIDATIYESAPLRANLLARLRADLPTAAGPLLLLGHTDVVYADPDGWTHPPFSGAIADGYVWGRGALDMKGMVAREVMVVRLLRRLRVPLGRDVILLSVADEEKAGRYGAAWMVENHWPEVECELVINEGGVGLRGDGRTSYLVATGEKGYVDLRLSARGDAGHASMPLGVNPIVLMSRALQRLAEYESPIALTPTMLAFFRAMYESGDMTQAPNGLGQLLEYVNALPEPRSRQLLFRMRNLYTPTIVRAGKKENVIPGLAEAWLNCRPLPGVEPSAVVDEVKAILDESSVEIEPIEEWVGTESEPQHPFFDAIREVIGMEEPDAIVAPILLAGMTDSRFFRARGATAYGVDLSVTPEQLLSTVHGVDERVGLDAIEIGTRRLFGLVVALAGAPPGGMALPAAGP
jgi:acetylornithine deacetylase/succinyl-diaminopimelate desuccinylase-like protein